MDIEQFNDDSIFDLFTKDQLYQNYVVLSTLSTMNINDCRQFLSLGHSSMFTILENMSDDEVRNRIIKYMDIFLQKYFARISN